MYKIYVRHYMPPGSAANDRIVDTETLMYDYPLDDNEGTLIDPKVKNEMGKAGSFEFSMEQNCPWYSSFFQMTSLIRVKYDDETIFYGRVLAIDTDMWGKRRVHCEGALAFLIDTMMEATKEDDRQTISLQTYVKDLIDTHNSFVADDPNKHFFYGEIPGYYSSGILDSMKPDNESRQFGTGSWTSVLNCLEDLTSKYGGYLRARYNDSDGKLYLDWLKDMFDPNVLNQPLELTENIIDMTSTVDVNGIFTVLIPEGQSNGNSLYLDDIPKTIIKVPLTPTTKTNIGPGLGAGVSGGVWVMETQ